MTTELRLLNGASGPFVGAIRSVVLPSAAVIIPASYATGAGVQRGSVSESGGPVAWAEANALAADWADDAATVSEVVHEQFNGDEQSGGYAFMCDRGLFIYGFDGSRSWSVDPGDGASRLAKVEGYWRASRHRNRVLTLEEVSPAHRAAIAALVSGVARVSELPPSARPGVPDPGWADVLLVGLRVRVTEPTEAAALRALAGDDSFLEWTDDGGRTHQCPVCGRPALGRPRGYFSVCDECYPRTVCADRRKVRGYNTDLFGGFATVHPDDGSECRAVNSSGRVWIGDHECEMGEEKFGGVYVAVPPSRCPGGHLFIINGDLTQLACDAILVPTDDNFWIEPYWRDVVPHEKLPLQWGTESVISLPAAFHTDFADKDKVAVWLGNIGVAGDQSGFDSYESTIREYIAAAKSAVIAGSGRLYGWPKPRLALPVVGSRAGGGNARRGDLLKGLVRTLQAIAQEHDVDIVLVTAGDKAYAAAQRARAESLRGTDLTSVWRFDNPALIARARALADTAIERHLVLFLGSGISAGAGLPTWTQLLDGLAETAGLSEDARNRLKTKDARDYATLIERRMVEKKIDFRAQIAAELTGRHYSLQHGLVASLPSDEAVTTNFDTLFEAAARTANRKLAVLPQDPRAAGGRWLLKMHGSIDHEKSIVLTRSDFLDMPRQYGALLGLVQGLLLMRHMMFVGYSLQDEDFQELIYEVRAARGDTEGRGTVLTLFRDDLDEELWSNDLEVVSMVDARPGAGPSIEYAARQLELFLDLLGYYATTCSAFFLDDTYKELVTDNREEQLRQTLLGLVESTADAEIGSVGYEVKEFLATLGATRQ